MGDEEDEDDEDEDVLDSGDSNHAFSDQCGEVMSLVIGAAWVCSHDGAPALFLLHEDGRGTLFPDITVQAHDASATISSPEGTRALWRNPELGRHSVICETRVFVGADGVEKTGPYLYDTESESENETADGDGVGDRDGAYGGIGFIVLHPSLNEAVATTLDDDAGRVIDDGNGYVGMQQCVGGPATTLVQIVTPKEELQSLLTRRANALDVTSMNLDQDDVFQTLFPRSLLAEYQQALLLCERFEALLDSDLVYKHAWEMSMRTLSAIAAAASRSHRNVDVQMEHVQGRICSKILMQVKDKEWTRMQCLTRVAHSWSQANVMLEHGQRIERDIVYEGERDDRDTRGAQFAPFDMQKLLLETYAVILKEAQQRNNQSSKDRVGDLLLSPLHTPLTLPSHGGSSSDVGVYDSKEWQRLRRSKDEISAMRYLLRTGQFHACAVFLQRHWSGLGATAQEAMRVYLHNLREEVSDAVPPHRYKVLCPAHGPLSWESLFFPDPHGVVSWYCQRAREMDMQSGQLLNALSLCDIGLSLLSEANDSEIEIVGQEAQLREALSCDLAGLEPIGTSTATNSSDYVLPLKILRNRIAFLHTLVYAAPNQAEFGLHALTLSAFESMSGRERLDLVLRGCSPDTVVSTLRQHIRPLMGKDKKSRSSLAWIDILTEYMVSITTNETSAKAVPLAPNLGLRKAQAIICASAQSLPLSQRVIPHTARQVRVALDVVHACPSSHEVDVMFAILDSMPDLSAHAKKSRAVRALVREIDQMEVHIDAAEMLRGNPADCSVPGMSSLSQVVPMEIFLPPGKGFHSAREKRQTSQHQEHQDSTRRDEPLDPETVSAVRLARMTDVLQALCFAAREMPNARSDLDGVWRVLFGKLLFLRHAFNDAVSLAVAAREDVMATCFRPSAHGGTNPEGDTQGDPEDGEKGGDLKDTIALSWSIEDECRILCVSHMLQIGAWEALKRSLLGPGDNYPSMASPSARNRTSSQKNEALSDGVDLCPVSQSVLESAVLTAARERFNSARSLWDDDALATARMMVHLVTDDGSGSDQDEVLGEDSREEKLNRWTEMQDEDGAESVGRSTLRPKNGERKARMWVRRELVREMMLLEAAEIARDFGWQGLVPLQLRLTTPKTQVRPIFQKSNLLFLLLFL
jgi:hypothetical protein